MKNFVAAALAISVLFASSWNLRSESFGKGVTKPRASASIEAPAASWATFISGSREGVLAPGILPNPQGGFYLYSTGDRPLIKFNADGSIAWEVRQEFGVNDVREVAQIDVLDNGDLIAIVGANSNPKVFGQQFVSDGRFLVQLRSADGSPVFVKDVANCWMTALKSRPEGGYFVGGYTLDAGARIGSDSLPFETNTTFVVQFTAGYDWAATGKWRRFANSIREIRTAGTGAAARIWVVGDAPSATVFGGKSIDQPGVFVALLNGAGAVLDAHYTRTYETTTGFSVRPSGGAYLATETQDRANSLSRLDNNGLILWTIPIEGLIGGVTGNDEPYVTGRTGNAGFITSFDGAGNIRWRRSDATRSVYDCSRASVLSDGRLAVCGDAQPSGIFIDDFFLRDFDQIEKTYYGTYVATLEISPNAKPVFRMQPRSQKLAIRGESVTLHAEVYSPTPVVFRWFKNGNLISNQTAADLLLPDVQAADSATYFAEVQNASGVTRSTAATVVVNSLVVSTMQGTDAAGAFVSPRGIAPLPDGTILVADSGQNQIKRVTISGVTVFAGTGEAGLSDGPATEAKFNAPSGVAFEFRYYGPTVYVADRGNNLLRRIPLAGDMASALNVSSANAGLNAPATVATLDGFPPVYLGGGASAALWSFYEGTLGFLAPTNAPGEIGGMVLDARSDLYVSDSVANEIRRTSPAFGTQIIAQGLSAPAGLALDEDENLFVVERGGNTVRKISTPGTQTIVAGIAGVSGLQNGVGSQALFNAPEAICFRNDSLIVADTGNHCLREIKFTPLNAANPGDAQIQFEIGNALSISVSGGASASFAIESTAQIGANAQWQNEGTVSANAGQGLSLAKPAGTRFYRARQLP